MRDHPNQKASSNGDPYFHYFPDFGAAPLELVHRVHRHLLCHRACYYCLLLSPGARKVRGGDNCVAYLPHDQVDLAIYARRSFTWEAIATPQYIQPAVEALCTADSSDNAVTMDAIQH